MIMEFKFNSDYTDLNIGTIHKKFMNSPKAIVKPHTLMYLNQHFSDPYYWLREKDNPDVIQYLKEENDFTEAMTAHTKVLQENLYKEMIGRIKETDESVPVKKGNFYYYHRTEKGKQYKIFCRKSGSFDAAEEILLDLNELAQAYDYLQLGVFEISPDHTLLAYSLDTAGSEEYTLYIKNLDNGKLLDEIIERTYYSLQWANDNRNFFYNTLDASSRPYRVHRHRLGTDPANDPVIFEEKDERFFVDIQKSRSESFLFIQIDSKRTSEVRFLPADSPEDSFQIIHPREDGLEYSVDHWGEYFLIRTNDRAINFKLMQTPVISPGKKFWKEVLPYREDIMIEGIDAFRNYWVIYERQEGIKQIRIINTENNIDHRIAFPEPIYYVYPSANAEFDTSVLRFSYTSLVTPLSIFDYEMNTRDRILQKQDDVKDYDPNLYISERIWATADDGTKIPISLVYKKGLQKNGQNPALLYGYGAYGITMDPSFSSNRISLLDRGFVFAIAHIRGGEDLGRRWYEAGKLQFKKNTFTDFIACAELMISEKFTSRNRLAIMGGSAGGLLMGAVVNIRPELFHAVVAKVPFVDVMNTMMDPSLPLTVTEYEEWGDPNIQESFEYIRSYSPYDNVNPQNYPAMLVTAGLNDPRVSYWEPAKWVAKLRAMKTDVRALLLKTNMGAGHGGASGRYDYLKEIAFDYAFILDQVGIGA
ncbi:S9 family peptidase [bacterium]|nr:S9 family peptidase [bacterium]